MSNLKPETLEITSAEPWYQKATTVPVGDEVYPVHEKYGITFEWQANIGWGQLMLMFDTETKTWSADTECMCSNEDKEFMKLILEKFAKQVDIR